MIKAYYQLTKPGIIYGNAVAAIAGFFLAERGHFNVSLFLGMLIGLSFIIASACVFNNLLDVQIDAKMERTKQRALVTLAISKTSALVYAFVLGLIGVIALAVFTNWLTLTVALFGHFAYVVLYTFGKRYTVHGTLIGSISGAIPPVVGYAAVTNRLDLGAAILFFILVFWQMPHFYGIAMNRLKDYQESGIPVLPAVKGFRFTKITMLVYIFGFMAVSSALFIFHYAGWTYLIVSILLGLVWLYKGSINFNRGEDARWGKKMFLFSLIVLMVQSLVLVLNFWLP